MSSVGLEERHGRWTDGSLIPGVGREVDRNLGLESAVFTLLSISFQSLPSGHIQGTFDLANKEENREKNRYPNILPSKTFVVLLSIVCLCMVCDMGITLGSLLVTLDSVLVPGNPGPHCLEGLFPVRGVGVLVAVDRAGC